MEDIRFSELANFTPRQLEAQQAADESRFVLYGGSRGPGKSYFLRWYGLRRLLQLARDGIRGAVGGLFTSTYTLLEDRQIGKIGSEFPDWLGAVKRTQSRGLGFHLKPEYGGGILALRNLDEPEKYKSAEFAFIEVDELTENPLDTFNKLRGSLRWPGVARPNFVGATNPGGIGHIWVRGLWIDRQFPREMEKLSREFAFVRALPDDNPHLTPEYWEDLESLPPDLARAWRWGDWDVFEGQFFGELRRDVHGFTGDPPEGWTFRMLDYGESAPSAVYWARVDHDGDVWLYRELYGPGMLYSTLAGEIKTATREPVRYTVASPDIFQVSKGTGVVGAEILGQHGVPVVKADNNRIEGWRQMKEFIHHRRIHVHLEHCPNWWRTVPAMVYDQTHPEDMDGDGEDHAAESTRYGLQSRPRPAARPKDEQLPPPGRTVEVIRKRAEVSRAMRSGGRRKGSEEY